MKGGADGSVEEFEGSKVWCSRVSGLASVGVDDINPSSQRDPRSHQQQSIALLRLRTSLEEAFSGAQKSSFSQRMERHAAPSSPHSAEDARLYYEHCTLIFVTTIH
jgi:hypothetical protein